jgi:hypothetical protein
MPLALACRESQITKLTDDGDPDGFLRLDELTLEQVDENVAIARVQHVLPQLDDRTARRPFGRSHGPVCVSVNMR